MELFGLEYVITSHQRIYLPYLATAFLIAYVYVTFYPQHRSKLFSKAIWWSNSAKMDYQYFFIVSLLKSLIILPLILSSKEVGLWVVLHLQEGFGYMQALQTPKSSVIVLYTLALFLVGDFSRYWLHRLLHLVPSLWEFHKVHHSAETLNPLTFYRVHPVENILFGLRYGVSVGVVTGLFIYLFGAKIGLIQVVGANLFVFAFGIIGANLRHSHVPLRYGSFLEKIFISPYQHQIHHSVELSHKNFGGVLALWDTLFQTLHIEAVRELEFGLKNSEKQNSLVAMLFDPFSKIAKRWKQTWLPVTPIIHHS